MKYALIDALRPNYPLTVLCETLSVSPSGYHDHRGRQPSARQVANVQLVSEIRVLHAQSHGAYGSPRIHAQLTQQGRRIGRERVRRLMREQGLRGRYRRKRCRTTDSNHRLPVAPNRLQQHFTCQVAHRVWLGDITYVPTDAGFLYVAAMKDLCTKQIVGWAMSTRIDAALVIDALTMAYHRHQPAAGLIVHTDRGSQYASLAFTDRLKDYRMLQSMSRRGNCYDNAPMESFFASLKGEYLDHRHFATQEQARTAVFQYIETFYNSVRLHSSIGYQTPNQFEAMLKAAA